MSVTNDPTLVAATPEIHRVIIDVNDESSFDFDASLSQQCVMTPKLAQPRLKAWDRRRPGTERRAWLLLLTLFFIAFLLALGSWSWVASRLEALGLSYRAAAPTLVPLIPYSPSVNDSALEAGNTGSADAGGADERALAPAPMGHLRPSSAPAALPANNRHSFPNMPDQVALQSIPSWYRRVLRVPSLDECDVGAAGEFVALTLYSHAPRSAATAFGGLKPEEVYLDALARLLASCVRFDICCIALEHNTTALLEVADEFFSGRQLEDEVATHERWHQSRSPWEDFANVQRRTRFLAISLKPAAIAVAARALGRPLVYLDCDMELVAFPALFTRLGASEAAASYSLELERTPKLAPLGFGLDLRDGGADVRVFNWQRALGVAPRPRLKAASGVVFVNSTEQGLGVVEAWARAQMQGANMLAPDDQMLDLLFWEGAFAFRARWGWLPHEYLPISQSTAVDRSKLVINHDGGRRPGAHGANSNIKPKLPRDMLEPQPIDHRQAARSNQLAQPTSGR